MNQSNRQKKTKKPVLAPKLTLDNKFWKKKKPLLFFGFGTICAKISFFYIKNTNDNNSPTLIIILYYSHLFCSQKNKFTLVSWPLFLKKWENALLLTSTCRDLRFFRLF